MPHCPPQRADAAGRIPDPHLTHSAMLGTRFASLGPPYQHLQRPSEMQLSPSSGLFPRGPGVGCVSQRPAAKPRGQGLPKAIFPQETSVLRAQGPVCKSVCVRIPVTRLHIGAPCGGPHTRLPEHLPYQPHQSRWVWRHLSLGPRTPNYSELELSNTSQGRR